MFVTSGSIVVVNAMAIPKIVANARIVVLIIVLVAAPKVGRRCD